MVTLCRVAWGKFDQGKITQGKDKVTQGDQEAPGGGAGSALLLLIQVIIILNIM